MDKFEKIEKKKLNNNKVLPGIILVLIGAIFLLNNFGLTDIDIGKFWPLILIAVGLFFLFGNPKD